MALLEVRDLNVMVRTHRGVAAAVRNMRFALERGETLGVIGESGSGKTLAMLALMGLLPRNAWAEGSIVFNGQELVGASEKTLCALRGDDLGMVFQEPMTALDPLQRIGDQVAEPLRQHRAMDRRAALAHAVELLDRVGIPDARERLNDYPHQFSGGQRQRIMIAAALACDPDVLIADEPTTALDVTVQAQILNLLRELVAERGMALILISHDLAVIARNVQRMMVLYAGAVAESGSTSEVYARMAHPYTRALLAARPRIGAPRGAPLQTIPGRVPDMFTPPPGCRFAGRCSFVQDDCRGQEPPLFAVPVHATPQAIHGGTPEILSAQAAIAADTGRQTPSVPHLARCYHMQLTP